MLKVERQKKFKLWFSRSIKILVSVGLLYLAYKKIDIQSVLVIVKKASPFFIGMAVLSFVISQVLSTVRLKKLLDIADCKLTVYQNLKLYLLGMFFNFFLPGGVGGDAYKVYVLHKQKKNSIKTLAATLFVDRLYGLLALNLLTILFFLALYQQGEIKNIIPHDFLIYLLGIITIMVGLVLFHFIIKEYFKIFLASSFKTLLLSFSIQLFQLVSVYFIMHSLNIEKHHLAYFFVFLLSSILSILSIAGIGIREYIFAISPQYLPTDPVAGVAIAFTFSMITAFVSLGGLFFYLKGINLIEYKTEE